MKIVIVYWRTPGYYWPICYTNGAIAWCMVDQTWEDTVYLPSVERAQLIADQIVVVE